MARPLKKGLAYFPFDVDFFSDRKIKVLLGKYGADGITVYLYILTEIYRENGYYLKKDKDFYYLASADLKMSSDKIEQIVVFLCERSMFDKQLFVSDDVLTAQSIQRRFQEAVSERGKKNSVEVFRKYWLLEEKETESFISYTDFESFSGKNPGYSGKNPSYSGNNSIKENKSKEKESKKESKPAEPSFDELIDGYTENEDLRFVLKEHLKTRKTKKAALTNYAITLSLQKLNSLADNDTGKIRIVKTSIERGWAGFFPEKQEPTPTKAGPLNNFSQETPDFGKIQKQLIERQMQNGS
jgi:hypothetical protein